MLNNPAYFASGTIYPSRFVTMSNQFRVQQAGANARVVGISQEGTKFFPDQAGVNATYAATTGDPIAVYGDLESNIYLELGGTVSAGAYLKSDANAKGVTSTGAVTDNLGAQALEDGVSGDKIRVQVTINPTRP